MRPVTATSTLWSSTRWNTTSRFPTSSEISTSGRRSRKAWISCGTRYSPAVVTALIRSVCGCASAASRAVRAPCSRRPSTSAAKGAYASPAAVGRTVRPARSVRRTPSSRSSADTAAETDGCVTTSSCAAAVTDPRRTTVRKACSWVRVTAIPAKNV